MLAVLSTDSGAQRESGASVAPINHLDRYREVGRVLARHGLGFLIGELGLERWVPVAYASAGRPLQHRSNAEHLRLALEELGPTFIKLGQLLSTRPDLLPLEYVTELSKLQADAPPVASAAVLGVIKSELGADAESLFAEFDETPLASASIGQAHAATLTNGTRVVVKVRRPGAVAQVHDDLEILENIATQASKRWRLAADYNVVGITEQFARTLRAELDYLQEGRNAERFAENFRTSRAIHIPKVFWDTTTSQVLTLERISGIKVDDLFALDEGGIDRSGVIARAVEAIAQMVFVDGFFHADPHPGNLFIEGDGRIGLIDFGMVGSITDEVRDQLAVLFVALSQNNPDRIGTALVKMSASSKPSNRQELRSDLAHFISLYEGRDLGELKIGSLITELLGILRRHRIQLRAEVVMLLRMLLMVEGMGVRLDPEFSLGNALRPYASRLAAEQFSPRALAKRAGRAGFDLAALGIELPERIRNLIDSIDSNGIEVHLRAAELDPLVGRIEKIGNRLVAGMVAAALISGIGQVAASDKTATGSWNRPLLGAGAGVVGALGAYLTLTAHRRRGSQSR